LNLSLIGSGVPGNVLFPIHHSVARFRIGRVNQKIIPAAWIIPGGFSFAFRGMPSSRPQPIRSARADRKTQTPFIRLCNAPILAD
jgi:hypothetical protein